MALTRLNEYNTGTTLTEAALEGEFDNIYSNALTLISPLTADLAAGGFRITGLSLGSLASPSLQFTGDVNTGIYSPAAEQVAIVCAGAAAATFTTGAVGPHAIGGATSANQRLRLLGSFTGSTETRGVSIEGTLTGVAGGVLYGLSITPTLAEAGSGVHGTIAGLYVAPTVTNAAATATLGATVYLGATTFGAGTTDGASLYIAGPTVGATTNYSLWATGNSLTRLDTTDATTGVGAGSLLQFRNSNGTNNDRLGISFWDSTGTVINYYGVQVTSHGAHTGDHYWADGATERMRLTNGGILALGTTVVQNAAAGDLVTANAVGLRGVNAAGNDTLPVIRLNSSNLISFGATRAAAAVAGNFAANFYIRFQDTAGSELFIPAMSASW